MIRIHELKLTIHQSKDEIPNLIVKKLHIKKEDLISYRIFKESIDARKKDMIYFNYCVDCHIRHEERFTNKTSRVYQIIKEYHYEVPKHGNQSLAHRPVIIGFGPAGMMAALLLAQEGYEPMIFERGDCIEERVTAVEQFWQSAVLNERTNVQFGEGGAGTFSDGKLTTRVKDLRSRKVLEELVAHGAPKEILYEAYPHIGTDLLRDIVRNIREDIIAKGGEIYFQSQITDFQVEQQKLRAVKVNDIWYPCDTAILAIGHSARDTFQALYEKQVAMSAKAFAVGARIEHLQSFINRSQYGVFYKNPKLPVASYRFVHKAKNQRGVYTFCMCPGGVVVPSTSCSGEVVVNGMSEYARNETNANSALLVQVTPQDFESDHALAGIAYQQNLEQRAFIMGKSSYRAPAQRVEDFVQHKAGDITKSILTPSYALGVESCDLHDLFPSYISDALQDGIQAFDKKMPGFAQDAILTAVETRSSSPVRIQRKDTTLQSINVEGLYPCGEGAGYAGGIVSAAIDGLRCAEKIIELYNEKRK